MDIKKRQSGLALVIVLWLLVLLTLLATSYSANTRIETRLSAYLVQSARAYALAEAGIWYAADDLINTSKEQTVPVDGTAYTLGFADGNINIRIQDESGKIDLNTARPELLQSLILSLDVDLDQDGRLSLWQAILDWRDKDTLVRPNGSEDNEYAAAGLEYGAKDGPFNAINELQLVLGMTPDIYHKMKPALTIHSHKSGVRNDFAPRETLLALPGQTPETVDNFLETRAAVSGAATPSTVGPPFTSKKTQSNVFTITSEGQIAETKTRLDAVIKIERNSKIPYTILSWEENKLSDTQQTSDAQDI